MNKVSVLILRAPGTNCDNETAFAFQRVGAETELHHINELIRRDARLSSYQIMVIPGGFTYGDDIAAGKILANELKIKLGEDVRRFIENGGLILGICNGFQVLVKAGYLSGSRRKELPVTLTTNDSARFECRWVHLSANTDSKCVFTKGIERMYLPIAHGEGKVVVSPENVDDFDIALRYCNEKGEILSAYPVNPNGSIDNIAGMCDETGRVFALMPHPERYIRPEQNPRWTIHDAGKYGDGLSIFTNAVKWITSI